MENFSDASPTTGSTLVGFTPDITGNFNGNFRTLNISINYGDVSIPSFSGYSHVIKFSVTRSRPPGRTVKSIWKK
tara:strand:+ start:78 stop:302 length:225 start_codon:yes stop_codon:yes gene_type:complete